MYELSKIYIYIKKSNLKTSYLPRPFCQWDPPAAECFRIKETWESFMRQRVPKSSHHQQRVPVCASDKNKAVSIGRRVPPGSMWRWVRGRVVMMRQQWWTSVRKRTSNSAKHKRMNNNHSKNKCCLTERRQFYKSHKHQEGTTHCQHNRANRTSEDLSRIT